VNVANRSFKKDLGEAPNEYISGIEFKKWVFEEEVSGGNHKVKKAIDCSFSGHFVNYIKSDVWG
jgi:hypothetical protein